MTTPKITPEMLERARTIAESHGWSVERALVTLQAHEMTERGTFPLPPTPTVDVIVIDVDAVRDAMTRFAEKMFDVAESLAAVLRDFDRHVEAALRPSPKRRRVTRCRSHGTDLDAGGRCPLCERRRR